MASVMDDLTPAKYIDLKFENKSDQEIADSMFVSRSTLMYWKKANGIKIRKSAFDMPVDRYLNLKFEAKLVDSVIAEMHGVSHVTLNRWKKSKGIKVGQWLNASRCLA
jgi:hypothetical protein